MRWYEHITRSTRLAKMISQGTVQAERRKVRQNKKRWEDNITEWRGSKLGKAFRKAENSRLKKIGYPIILGAPKVI